MICTITMIGTICPLLTTEHHGRCGPHHTEEGRVDWISVSHCKYLCGLCLKGNGINTKHQDCHCKSRRRSLATVSGSQLTCPKQVTCPVSAAAARPRAAANHTPSSPPPPQLRRHSRTGLRELVTHHIVMQSDHQTYC